MEKKSINTQTNKIRLVNGSENKDITVNFGLAEMVRTFFDNKVRALVRKTRGNQYELIQLVKEADNSEDLQERTALLL